MSLDQTVLVMVSHYSVSNSDVVFIVINAWENLQFTIQKSCSVGHFCQIYVLIKYGILKPIFSSPTGTKYKETYCSHPSRPRLHHTALKFYVQVFQKSISPQPLIRKHSYLDHRYPGWQAFIPRLLTPGSILLSGARGQKLGHF